jgi:hypothetical protein
MGSFDVSLEFHFGDDFPAYREPHRRSQFALIASLTELPQQLHLLGLAGGIFVRSRQS